MIVSVPIYLALGKKYVRVEIQLRTLAMDFWATLEHQQRYKKDVDIAASMERELFTCAHLSAELDERMDGLRQLMQQQNEHGDAPPSPKPLLWTDQSQNLRQNR